MVGSPIRLPKLPSDLKQLPEFYKQLALVEPEQFAFLYAEIVESAYGVTADFSGDRKWLAFRGEPGVMLNKFGAGNRIEWSTTLLTKPGLRTKWSAFSPDDRWLIVMSGSEDPAYAEARVWDLRTLKAEAEDPEITILKCGEALDPVCFSEDRHWLIACGKTSIYLWNLMQPEPFYQKGLFSKICGRNPARVVVIVACDRELLSDPPLGRSGAVSLGGGWLVTLENDQSVRLRALRSDSIGFPPTVLTTAENPAKKCLSTPRAGTSSRGETVDLCDFGTCLQGLPPPGSTNWSDIKIGLFELDSAPTHAGW